MPEASSPFVLFGAAVGLNALPGLKFDLNSPYAGCRLCGTLYQSDLDRAAHENVFVRHQAQLRRTRWREVHARRYHTEQEVESFKKTGLAFTPEAANKLAPFGVIAPLDTVLHDETTYALLEAPRAPLNDVEGT